MILMTQQQRSDFGCELHPLIRRNKFRHIDLGRRSVDSTSIRQTSSGKTPIGRCTPNYKDRFRPGR